MSRQPIRSAIFFSLLAFIVPLLQAQSDRIVTPIDPQRTVLLEGGINPSVRRESDQGSVEGGKRLGHMTLMLTRTAEQRATLNWLLQEQQDPSSFEDVRLGWARDS